MLVGYARTSTVEQEAGLSAQIRDLQAAGVEKVFSEKVSSVARREELARALDFMREGDTLIVTKLDRLARSVRDLLDIVDTVEGMDAHLRVLAMGLDTGGATGRMMLQVLGAVAEFERALMLERQREGIRKAQLAGKWPCPDCSRQEPGDRTHAGVGPRSLGDRATIGHRPLKCLSDREGRLMLVPLRESSNYSSSKSLA